MLEHLGAQDRIKGAIGLRIAVMSLMMSSEDWSMPSSAIPHRPPCRRTGRSPAYVAQVPRQNFRNCCSPAPASSSRDPDGCARRACSIQATRVASFACQR